MVAIFAGPSTGHVMWGRCLFPFGLDQLDALIGGLTLLWLYTALLLGDLGGESY